MIKEDAEKCCLNQFLKLYEHFMESDDAIKGIQKDVVQISF